MKKFISFAFAIVMILTLSACYTDSADYPVDGKPIVVLPDKETAETINGYKPETESTEAVTSDLSSSESTPNLTIDNASIVGNKNSLKFHVKDCRYATKILEENLALFNSADDAAKEGYKPCGVCFKK